MRQQHQLLHSRARVQPRFAILPEEGIPASRLRSWPDIKVYIQAAPALGASFAQYRLDLTAGQGGGSRGDGTTEHFIYVLSGGGRLFIQQHGHDLRAGSYALIPPDRDYRFEASEASRLLLLRKTYEPEPGIPLFSPIIAHESNVPSDAFLGDVGAKLQLLIPDEFQFDMAMNIFTFDVGHCLPYVETHVMEHGLYFLQGKGVYYLDAMWMEVEATDFIWMGPYCPQSFYATGLIPSKYIYYKNVNREIPLR
jgi:(S)-ureidoglycine aminohydrolase